MSDELHIILEQEYTIAHKRSKGRSGEKISKRALEQLPQYTCHTYVPQVETIFAGRKNGDILQWKLQRGREGVINESTSVGKHGGSVTCLLHHQQYEKLLISGSSDSCIKIWDILGGGIEGSRCVQTIPAHNATVSAISAHCDVFLSCSCDRTLKVWKAEEGRSGLKYPWFVVKQLFVFDYWTTCVWSFPSKIAEDTLGEVYVGDAGGGLTQLRSVAAHQLESEQVSVDELRLVRPHVRSFRSLGVTCVLPVPTLNVILTTTYDDAVRLSDISTIDTLVNLTNTKSPGSRFTALAWSAQTEELVLADTEGDILIWNSRMDKFVASTHAGLNVATISVTKIGGKPVILATTASSIKVFSIKRSLPYKRHSGHTQRVVGVTLFASPDKTPVENNLSLLSASADNTIRVWSILQTLDNTKTLVEKYSEISACIYIADEKTVVTGHENGSLKMWGLQTEKTHRVAGTFSSLLPPPSPPPNHPTGHSNTISAIAYGTHRYNAHGLLEERPHIITCGFDGHIALWEMSKEATSIQVKCDIRWKVCRDELLCIAYDTLKHTYITAGNAGEVSIWTLKDPQKPSRTGLLSCADGHDYAVTCLSLDGNILYTGGEDEMIRVWDLVSLELLKCWHDEGELNDILVIKGSGNLLTCSRSGGVKMWRKGVVLSTFNSPNHEELRCLSYCDNTGEVFVGTEDGGLLRVSLDVHDDAGSQVGSVRSPKEDVCSHTGTYS